jgi:hypothetical protein
MTRLLVLALVAALGLSACGAGSTDALPEEADELPASPVPDVARIVCVEEGAARVETPAVKPQGDGVHLEIVNETGGERAFSATDAQGGGLGGNAPTGTSTQVVDLGPGTLTVSCEEPETEPGPGEPLEVVDEDGVWVSTRLDCEEQFSAVLDYVMGAEGESADPLDAARKGLEGYRIEPDDVFELAGYPEAESINVRLVRDGESLAVVHLVPDGAGKWLVDMVTGCSSLQEG